MTKHSSSVQRTEALCFSNSRICFALLNEEEGDVQVGPRKDRGVKGLPLSDSFKLHRQLTSDERSMGSEK